MLIDSLTALTVLFFEEDSKLFKHMWGLANEPFAGVEHTLQLENNLKTSALIPADYSAYPITEIISNLSKLILKRIALQKYRKVYLKDATKVEPVNSYAFTPVRVLVCGNVVNSISDYIKNLELITRNSKTVREFATKFVDILIEDMIGWLKKGKTSIKVNIANYIKYPGTYDPILESYFLPEHEYFSKYRLRAIYSLERLIKGIIETIIECYDTEIFTFPDNYYVYNKTSLLDIPENYNRVESLTTSAIISGVTWDFFENEYITDLMKNDDKIYHMRVSQKELDSIIRGDAKKIDNGLSGGIATIFLIAGLLSIV